MRNIRGDNVVLISTDAYTYYLTNCHRSPAMAKDKKGSKAAAPAAKPKAGKAIESVKAGRVTKPAEAPKKVAKTTAKTAAKTAEKKKSKKTKEPTPEPSSEEEEETSNSSASSDSESEEEVAPAKAAAPKANGTAKASAAKDDSSDDDDDSSASDSDEEPAPKKVAAPKVNGAVNGKAKAESSDDSEDDEEDSDDSSDDEKVDTKAGALKTAEAEESSEASSDEEAAEADAKLKPNGEAADDDESEDDEEDTSDEEEAKPAKVEEAPSKKRKAEAEPAPASKRNKVTVNGEQKDATANLFIGNLSWSVDEEWLTREFEEFGELAGVRIITDRDSGRSKGFGYVEFVSVDNAIAAVEAKTGADLDGRQIRIDFSEGRQNKGNANQTPQQRSSDRAQRFGDAPKEPTSTLWVGNISFDATQDTLTEYFSEFGGIKGIRLPTDRDTGAPKGFGYVEMDSVDEAKAAFEGLQGSEMAGRPMRLDYAAARTGGDDSPRGGRGGFSGGRGRGGFNDRGGRGGGRGGFGGRGRGAPRGGRGGTTNRGGFGDFSGKKTTF